MSLFSTRAKNAKIKKRIAQLKNQLVPVSSWRSHNDSFENISDMFDTWKQKGHHAFYHLNEHAKVWKNKAKENPKTALALATGLILAGILLIRKN
ncbi:hypothetical protein [Bartonella doshiae]|uniref:Uncharacterized protein n=2 Tax=Bartonella doshiae TaxID=33044 RepID=A0A380ZFH2_BARDO|nr:hypothetical protein [Bartonella doshiae]EJF80528.1 hypothetical protein MCS_01178 [Bartonella doshiae NCTC 12862 = ATCC 700133]MBB6158838.1 hypothetical protein [Bartonella doshiae]SUV45728.1 Uncharacterised protein [Bartonella doshiae]